MSYVLETLSEEELKKREINLLKQLDKVKQQLIKIKNENIDISQIPPEKKLKKIIIKVKKK
jgi:hypothetical protein